MVKIPHFEVAAWFDDHAHDAPHDLAGTASATLSIKDLIELSEHSEKTREALDFNLINLNYNSPMRGGHQLRDNLAALYSARSQGVTRDDILTCNAGIDANNIVLTALLGPGDHVVCQYPTYQQLYDVPRSQGVEVSLWRTDPSKKWQVDMEELKTMIKDNTRMIIINVPNNPSGAIIPKPQLEEIIDLAQEKGIIVFCDEAFRPLFHGILPSDDNFPNSAVNMGYKKVVVSGTMSKAYGLPGIRAGWIVSRDPQIIADCFKMRYYTTTTVSQLNEAVAAEALSERCIHALLARNIQYCKQNVEAWQNFIDEHAWACSWVKPVAGTTAMVKFHKMGKPVDDAKFCLVLQEKAGVCLIPGSKCFGDGEHFKGYVRTGVGLDPKQVKAGLVALSKFMEDEFADVAVAAK
jgi:aspartate/methionine/tyrosine aminotransferase